MADSLNVSRIEKNIAQKVAAAEADKARRAAESAADERTAADSANEATARMAARNEEREAENTESRTYNVSSEITLNSTWKCKRVNEKYMFDETPSVGTREVSVAVETPAGLAIQYAIVKAAVSGPESGGISALTVNTTGLTVDKGAKGGAIVPRSAKITPVLIGGRVSLRFSYVANGTKKDTAPHTATVKLSKVQLSVVYKKSAGAADDTPAPKDFPAPPQSVAIYDPATKKSYWFDGVIKLQHTGTLKLEEDLSEKKAYEKTKYVNNAKVEPDKVTLNVIMSDVYTDENDLTVTVKTGKNGKKTSTGETRSTAAVKVLHALKDDRTKLMVITPQYIYSDMLLSGMSINQDEENPYGWEGQLTFQKVYEQKPPKDQPQVKPPATSIAQQQASRLYQKGVLITQQ